MRNDNEEGVVRKQPTGIEGFDFIAHGGLPKGRTALLTGTAGSAKTVFAAHFLAAGIERANQSGVFVTFEEPPDDIRRNMLSLGFDVARWEAERKWIFVDACPTLDDTTVIGDYHLGALMARIEHAANQVGAGRVVLDSLAALLGQFRNDAAIRREVYRIIAGLKRFGVTAIVTAERVEEYGALAKYGVEEFVSDSVLIVRNLLEDGKRRRTIEILKFRGATHQKGEYPFSIIPGEGVIVIPLSAIELKQHSTDIRVTSGNSDLDQMCGGGFFRDSIILVSGATGTGKTLITTEFISGGVKNGEKCLLFAFEESREQLIRNATGWGVDFAQMERDGRLKLVCEYPETASLEDHLIRMKAILSEFGPGRVAVDSLSALERVGTVKGFREFVIGLTSFIKHRETAGLFTATTPTLLGGSSVTETHISTITDSIILLRYVEIYGEMRRGLTVLKMRGSGHDKNIREFSIDGQGMHIGKPYRDVSGILAGNPHQISPGELERIGRLFGEAGGGLEP